MPKAPLTSRTLLWAPLSDGTKRVVDWYLVGTSLGVMVEARPIHRGGGSIVNEDLLDSSVTDISVLPPAPSGYFMLDEAVGSAAWPHFRDNDPTTGVGR